MRFDHCTSSLVLAVRGLSCCISILAVLGCDEPASTAMEWGMPGGDQICCLLSMSDGGDTVPVATLLAGAAESCPVELSLPRTDRNVMKPARHRAHCLPVRHQKCRRPGQLALHQSNFGSTLCCIW